MQNLFLQKDVAAAGYLFEAPSPPRLLSWGVYCVSSFADSESGHMQSVKLLQNMVSNTTHTLSVYILTRGVEVTGNNAADHILE
jgi:hypothetical protein